MDKNAISSHSTAKVNGVVVASGQGIIGWDRAAKRIVSYGFGSLGGRGESVIEKRNGKWYSAGMGVGPAGHIGAGMTFTTIVDDNTHESLGIGRMRPQKGEPLPNQTSRATRSSTRANNK